MDRRSPLQKRTDDHAFPVRLKVLVPERGFENLLLDVHRWLEAEVGRGSYAVHGAGAGLTHATAWYFRTVEEVQAFVTRFPMLELADGTELPTYQINPRTCRSGAAPTGATLCTTCIRC